MHCNGVRYKQKYKADERDMTGSASNNPTIEQECDGRVKRYVLESYGSSGEGMRVFDAEICVLECFEK